MLSALGANELGFLFGPVPGPDRFTGLAFSLGLLSGPNPINNDNDFKKKKLIKKHKII